MKREEQQRDKKMAGSDGRRVDLVYRLYQINGERWLSFPTILPGPFFEGVRGLLENRGKNCFWGLSPYIAYRLPSVSSAIFVDCFFLKIAGQSLDFVWN